jgi:excisionase family DNA binding protein
VIHERSGTDDSRPVTPSFVLVGHGERRGACVETTMTPRPELPVLLTVDETAVLLRTTRKAIYSLIERRHVPGVTRIGRRVLFRADDLLHWLGQKRAPSPKE